MFLLYLLILYPGLSSSGYCPPGCLCNNTLLMSTCSSLSILPITLNPHIASLSLHNSSVTALDDGLHFYEALINLNLSHNRITAVMDGAFTSQVINWGTLDSRT